MTEPRQRVHVYKDGKYRVDETLGTEIYKGRPLERRGLFAAMVASTIS